MGNLIRTDFRRIFRDRLFLVVCIICGALGLMQPLLFRLLFGVLGTSLDQIGMMIDAKSLFFSAFSPGNNAGFVAPILLSIIICKDFHYGTVRNKIISGHSRTKIFLSLLITTSTVMCIVIFFHALITLLMALPFYEYQQTPFGGADFGYLLASLGLEIAIYLFISAIVCFFCVAMKNTGVSVVMYVAANFLFTLMGSIVSVVLVIADPADKVLYNILKFFANSNPFTTALVGSGAAYTSGDVLTLLLPCLVGIGFFGFFGAFVFNKKDLK